MREYLSKQYNDAMSSEQVTSNNVASLIVDVGRTIEFSNEGFRLVRQNYKQGYICRFMAVHNMTTEGVALYIDIHNDLTMNIRSVGQDENTDISNMSKEKFKTILKNDITNYFRKELPTFESQYQTTSEHDLVWNAIAQLTNVVAKLKHRTT